MQTARPHESPVEVELWSSKGKRQRLLDSLKKSRVLEQSIRQWLNGREPLGVIHPDPKGRRKSARIAKYIRPSVRHVKSCQTAVRRTSDHRGPCFRQGAIGPVNEWFDFPRHTLGVRLQPATIGPAPMGMCIFPRSINGINCDDNQFAD